MSDSSQLEFNFDDPVEYLAPPSYLQRASLRPADDRLTQAVVLRIDVQITVALGTPDPLPSKEAS
jgi:hypothetical protein